MKSINTKSLVISLAASVLLVACSGEQKRDRAALPKDEATAEERARINEALQEISDLTEEFGERHEFSAVQIIVTSEDAKKSDRIGYCIFGRDFVALNRLIFDDIDGEPFTTLLHELGHCYYRKRHDEELLSKEFTYMDARSMTIEKIVLTKCASVMCPNPGRIVPANEKRYYVGELLGHFRATIYSEIENYQ